MIQKLYVQTNDQTEFIDITGQIEALVAQSGVGSGVVYLYSIHTTCGLTIQENCDPGVQQDMLLLLNRIAPRRDPGYRHIEDNSAAHLQTSAIGTSQILFVEEGRLVLGRWQAVYLGEFDGPRERTVLVKILPDR